MSGLWKVLVVLGVVFAVGCGAATAQDSPSPIAQEHTPTPDADERLDAADRLIQTLTEELETRRKQELQEDRRREERIDALFREMGQEAPRQELPAGATLEAIPPPSLLQEGDAIKLVQFELRKSLNNCASLGPYRCSEDHVLKAFGAGRAMPSFRVGLISAIGKTKLEQGEWTAVYESDSRRWRVEVGSSAFYVYETTRIVEGVAP